MSETPAQPVTEAQLKKQFRWQDLAVVLAILGGFGSGYVHLIGEARAEADAGVAVLRPRVEALEGRVERISVDLHNTQLDIRELYKTVTTGRRSERLEQPPPPSGDGGAP